jgi:hypothetical protein
VVTVKPPPAAVPEASPRNADGNSPAPTIVAGAEGSQKSGTEEGKDKNTEEVRRVVGVVVVVVMMMVVVVAG